MTFLLVAAAAGVLVGGWIGYRVGRAVERVKPSRKDKEREGKERRKLLGR